MIATIDTLHNLITDPPGIFKFDKDGIAHSVIQDCAQYAIWIESNDPIGNAEHHTEQANSIKIGKEIHRKFDATNFD